MKKFYLFLLAMFTLIINVDAKTIENKKVTGPNEIKSGEDVSLDFSFELNDPYTPKRGIWLVLYELDFDPDLFTVTSVNSKNNEWNSIIFVDDGKYYVLSIASDEQTGTKCADGILHCGNYNVTIKFYAKATSQKKTEINMGELDVGLFEVNEENPNYNTDEMIELEEKSSVYHEITIKETNNKIKEEPKSIIQKTVPSTEFKAPTTKKTTTTTTRKVQTGFSENQNNTYLSYIDIEGYKITYRKYKTDYEIYINKNVNSLNIKTATADQEAKYTINGADDLKANDYKVTIDVTSGEDKKTYTINVKFKEESQILKKLKTTFNDNKNILIPTGGILLILIIIIIIMIKSYNKKLDKALNKF